MSGRYAPLPQSVRDANTWGGQVRLDGRTSPGPRVSVVQINVPPEYERDWTIHLGQVIDDVTGAPFTVTTPRTLLATVQYGSRLGSPQEFTAHVPAEGATWSVRGSSIAVLAQYVRATADPVSLALRVSAEILDATPPQMSAGPWDPPRLLSAITQLPAQATGAALVASVPRRAIAFRILPSQTALAAGVVGPAALDGWIIGEANTSEWVFLQRVARLSASNIGFDWCAIPAPVRALWSVTTTAAAAFPCRVEWLLQP